MSEKISELPAASTLDGTEEVPLVQSSTTKKVTVNDLLPVKLQADKTVDLDGHELEIVSTIDGSPFSLLYVDPDVSSYLRANVNGEQGNVGVDPTDAHGTGMTYDGPDGASNIAVFMDHYTLQTDGEGQYNAATHTFTGVINLPTQAAPSAPNDGDIWREDNTNSGLKIRINGVTKTIVVS